MFINKSFKKETLLLKLCTKEKFHKDIPVMLRQV